jgi:hypothetical protein
MTADSLGPRNQFMSVGKNPSPPFLVHPSTLT